MRHDCEDYANRLYLRNLVPQKHLRRIVIVGKKQLGAVVVVAGRKVVLIVAGVGLPGAQAVVWVGW
jgi:hypothetical protein